MQLNLLQNTRSSIHHLQTTIFTHRKRKHRKRLSSNKTWLMGAHKKIFSKSYWINWFGTKRTSVWFQINRKMVNTIWFGFDLIRFWKYFFVCKYVTSHPAQGCLSYTSDWMERRPLNFKGNPHGSQETLRFATGITENVGAFRSIKQPINSLNSYDETLRVASQQTQKIVSCRPSLRVRYINYRDLVNWLCSHMAAASRFNVICQVIEQ